MECPKCHAQLEHGKCPVCGYQDPLVGHILTGKYRIEEPLGEGGMGKVYRGVEVDTGRNVAIKVLHAHLAQDEGAIERFLQEARLASSLNHPHTITIYDYGVSEPEKIVYIAMEFLRGITLYELNVRNYPLPLKRMGYIIRQVLMALEAAHAIGLVHRDLKPDNIFVEERGEGYDHVTVLDFGIAKHFGMLSPGSTVPGMIWGTPEYMSPEQVKGEPLDPRSDLYSVAVIMYELLAGRPPFYSENPTEVLIAHVHKEIPPIREVAPDVEVPPALEAIIMWGLAKNREERIGSAEEFRSVLESWMKIAGVAELCPHCGAVINPGEIICPSCLKPISTEQEATRLLCMRHDDLEKIRSHDWKSSPLWIKANPEQGRLELALTALQEDRIILIDSLRPVVSTPLYGVRHYLRQLVELVGLGTYRELAEDMGMEGFEIEVLTDLMELRKPKFSSDNWLQILRSALLKFVKELIGQYPHALVVDVTPLDDFAKELLLYELVPEYTHHGLPMVVLSAEDPLVVGWEVLELTNMDVAEMDRRIGEVLSPHEYEEVRRALPDIAGNPYHLRHVLLALQDALSVTGSLTALLERRFAALPPLLRSILQSVAVARRPVEKSFLMERFSLSREQVEEYGYHLKSKGYIIEVNERWTIPCSLWRDSIVRQLPSAIRTQIHGMFLKHARPEEVPFHLDGVDRFEEAGIKWRELGDIALAFGDYHGAYGAFTYGLEAARRAYYASPGTKYADLYSRILLLLGETLINDARLDELDGLIKDYESLFEVWNAEIYYLVARRAHLEGDLEQMKSLAMEALSRAEDPEFARKVADFVFMYSEWQPTQALFILSDYLLRFRADPSVINSFAYRLRDEGYKEETHVWRRLALLLASGDDAVMVDVLEALFAEALADDEWENALTYLYVLAHFHGEVGNVMEEANTYIKIAQLILQHDEARTDEAKNAATRALTLSRRVGWSMGEMMAEAMLG